MTDVLRLGPADLPEAVEVLVRAFEHDPFFRHCFPGPDRQYVRKIEAVFQMLFGTKLEQGEPVFGIRVGDDLVGTVALEQPGTILRWGSFMKSPPLLGLLLKLALASGPRAVMRLDRWDKGARAFRPNEPHFYVLGLGVLPEYQSKGYGRALMEELHREVDGDAEAIGVGLDAETEKNVSFYQYLGYEVTGNVDLGGVDMYCMFRPSSRYSSESAAR